MQVTLHSTADDVNTRTVPTIFTKFCMFETSTHAFFSHTTTLIMNLKKPAPTLSQPCLRTPWFCHRPDWLDWKSWVDNCLVNLTVSWLEHGMPAASIFANSAFKKPSRFVHWGSLRAWLKTRSPSLMCALFPWWPSAPSAFFNQQSFVKSWEW